MALWADGDLLTPNNLNNPTLTTLTMGGAIDCANNVITNIGAAGTDFTATGGLTLADVLVVSGTGPNAIGTTTQNNIALNIGGAYTSGGAGTSASAVRIRTNLTGFSGDTSLLTLLEIGLGAGAAIITQTATENIDVISSLEIAEPSITDNLTGDITIATTVHIVDAPTEGEDNFALLVDSGATRFDGNIGFYETAPIAQQTGVAVSSAGIHAALVALGLITA